MRPSHVKASKLQNILLKTSGCDYNRTIRRYKVSKKDDEATYKLLYLRNVITIFCYRVSRED